MLRKRDGFVPLGDVAPRHWARAFERAVTRSVTWRRPMPRTWTHGAFAG